jgi:tetratricopeptide (TPR) repeat protein
LIALEEKDFFRAIDELEQSNPQNTRHLYELAQAYDYSGDRSKARDLYRKIIDYNALNSLEYSFVRHKAREALALI